MQVLLIVNLVTIIILFIFILRINKTYKDKILAVTNKVDYLNIKMEVMLKLVNEYKKKSICSKIAVKNALGKKYDELDEVIMKYLEIA